MTYPDILGYVTGGARAAYGSVQVALAVSPPLVRAGRPFQALLLAQNTTDTLVELSATLNLPGRDAARQKGRFAAPQPQMICRLRPGEAGYLLLPIMSHPDTAPGNDYRLGVTVSTRSSGRGHTVRADSGGAPVDPAALSAKRRETLDRMRQLTFSSAKRFGLKEELEAAFRVVPDSKQTPVNPPKNGWFSLWNLGDDGSAEQLLAHYSTRLQDEVFPNLKIPVMFEPLRQATEARFRAAGYPLKPLEAIWIAKLLTLIVHMADPGDDSFDYLGSQNFNMAVLLNHPLSAPVSLPHWFDGLLRAIALDERVAANAPAFICNRLYAALIRDAIPFAFNMIHKVTGEEIGSPEEIQDYTENFVSLLNNPQGMDFAHAYLPLIMGGLIVFDRVIFAGEILEDTLRGMGDVLDERDAEWTEDNDLVFIMTREAANRSLRLFGFQL